jgi:hypothetical protein
LQEVLSKRIPQLKLQQVFCQNHSKLWCL